MTIASILLALLGAQSYALPHTEVLQLTRGGEGGSDVQQVLYVSLPRDYESSTARYPVVYLLDPDYAFAIAHNVVEHFVDRGNLDPLILVGIGYPGQSQDIPTYRRHRTRDYTPTHTLRGGYGEAFQRFSGEGPAFLEFLDKRLLPFIDGRYRTNGERALVGHSYGGLFVTFALLTRPELFNRYLAVSPSYWYDDRVVYRMEEKAATMRTDLNARVFLTAGALENPPHTRIALADDLESFAKKLAGRGYPSLELESRLFPDETHNSVFPSAFTRGIRWLFR